MVKISFYVLSGHLSHVIYRLSMRGIFLNFSLNLIRVFYICDRTVKMNLIEHLLLFLVVLTILIVAIIVARVSFLLSKIFLRICRFYLNSIASCIILLLWLNICEIYFILFLNLSNFQLFLQLFIDCYGISVIFCCLLVSP
jgi:hypothetical protein